MGAIRSGIWTAKELCAAVDGVQTDVADADGIWITFFGNRALAG